MANKFNTLNDPEFAKLVAELYVAGASREEMADAFKVTKRTISTWSRDPRVQAHARTMSVERVQRITRKIDGEIEARLATVEDWDTELILKVRKEYLERALKVAAGENIDSGKITDELAEAMDENPDFAEQLRKLITAEPAATK